MELSYVVNYLNCRNLNPRYFLNIIYIYIHSRLFLSYVALHGDNHLQVKIERTRALINRRNASSIRFLRALKKEREKFTFQRRRKKGKKKGSRFISRQIQSATIWRTCNPCAICMIWTRRPKNFLVEFPTFKLRGGESLNRHGLPSSYFLSFFSFLLLSSFFHRLPSFFSSPSPPPRIEYLWIDCKFAFMRILRDDGE